MDVYLKIYFEKGSNPVGNICKIYIIIALCFNYGVYFRQNMNDEVCNVQR